MKIMSVFATSYISNKNNFFKSVAFKAKVNQRTFVNFNKIDYLVFEGN